MKIILVLLIKHTCIAQCSEKKLIRFLENCEKKPAIFISIHEKNGRGIPGIIPDS